MDNMVGNHGDSQTINSLLNDARGTHAFLRRKMLFLILFEFILINLFVGFHKLFVFNTWLTINEQMNQNNETNKININIIFYSVILNQVLQMWVFT
jgi:hypothetical protein